ncbi:MAG TPA: twin-arginine translocase TatA/TatE family subunit [Solirubrobacterales bacterium]|jgi:sec-independent protein translocase protein TatA
MANIGPLEIGIVLVIALIVFGPKKLPELGNSLGKGIREFKGSITGEDSHEEAPAAIGEGTGTAAPRTREHHSA